MPQRKEMTTILVNVITTKMVLMFPRLLIINSANAAWIEALYNIAVAFFLFSLIYIIYKGKKNIIELAQLCGGKALRIIVGLVVFVTLMINYAAIIRIFPETIKLVLLQDFNVRIITIIFETVIGIGAFIGIEAIARVNYLFMPVLGGVLTLFVLCLVPYCNIYNILPVFGGGLLKIFINGLNTLSLFSDMLILNIMLPFYENRSEAEKSGKRAFYISSIVIFVIIAIQCLVYPYPASEKFMIPVYQLTRLIHFGSFFSRLEAVFEFAWSVMLLLYSSIYVYTLCFVWQTTFNLKFYRPLIFPIVIISGVVALLPDSMIALMRTERWENIIVYPIAFGLPFIFGLISRKYYKTGEKQ